MQTTVSLVVLYVSTLESFTFCADGTLTGMLIYNIIDDLVIIIHTYTEHGKRNTMLQSMIMVTKQRSISMFGCL